MNDINDILNTMEYGPAVEDASEVRQWLSDHKATFGHLIGGKFTEPKEGSTFKVSNPANGEELAIIAKGSKADVDLAAKAAAKAATSWAALTGNQRARHLYALARQVQKHARFLAVLETLDNGKTIRETRDIDIPLVARHFYHHAGWAELVEDEFPGHVPAGVCGLIIPWNFPLLMLSWKVAPALAAGCTVVLKPAEHTPLTAIAFGEICKQAGLPDGVFNIVNGDGDTGRHVVDHPAFNKIAFTGSTEVGRIIRKATAGTGKKLSLELGGKSPFIVYESADIDSAVEGVVDAIWFNQGEVCCAGSRLLVQEGIAERFYDKLKARMEKLRLGNPLDKTMDMGAVVAPVQLENITKCVASGVSEGATLWQPEWAKALYESNIKGSFYPPTLFTDVESSSNLAQEEIFGPVISAMTFRTPDEAMVLANNTRYGLAASIWSQNLDVAFDAARRVKAGIVWINSTNLFDASVGFGGYKESGYGREGGSEGMAEYLVPEWQKSAAKLPKPDDFSEAHPVGTSILAKPEQLDRTMKMYVGGKQARPDGGYSYPVYDYKGNIVSEAGLGSRKDIRNAVEAARKADGWSGMTGHQRAQVLYFLAENLEARASDFAEILCQGSGLSTTKAMKEVSASIARIMYYAAWADKYDSEVRAPAANMLALALKEPYEVIGISCPDETPLLAMISTVIPAIAMGNRVVVSPSPLQPLVAGSFYQVLDTSDVPGGVINIITGKRDTLAETMAAHDDINAMWYFGDQQGSTMVEQNSSGSLKPTWVNYGKARDWFDRSQGQGKEFLFKAVQIKSIWTPFGV